MPPPDLSQYLLSPSTATRIFQSQIIPTDLPATIQPSANQPLAVIAVGQTGAGKTRLCREVLSALASQRGQPVHLIADTYKTYHPDYATLISSPGTARHASAAAGPDARAWLLMAAREAARRRLDVLLESACRHPDDFEALIRVFSEGGYRTEVLILAVPYGLSRLGLHVRYLLDLPEASSRGLPLRLTPVKVHDDSYEGLLRSAGFLDRQGADQVAVVRRNGLVAFAIEGKGGVREALEKERRRPLSSEEISVVEDGIALMKERDMEEEAGGILDVLGVMMPGGGKMEERFPELRALRLGTEPAELRSSGYALRLGMAEKKAR